MSRHMSTRNISSKSMHALLSNLATDRQTDKHGQKHLPRALSEVIREHSASPNLRQGSRGKFFTGGNRWGTVVGGYYRKHKFHEGSFFPWGNISSPGLTLKRAPRSLKMARLDITHTTSY